MCLINITNQELDKQKKRMESQNTFKTKTGFCHILPDKIVLSRGGVMGSTSDIVVGNSINRVLIIYGIITIYLLYSAINNFQSGHIIISIIYTLVGLFLLYGIISSLNNSATPVIERSSIRNIKLKEAIFGLTRSRFEVLFEDEDGKIKKRLIMLPGSLTGGKRETEKAVKIMQMENLLD